MKFKKFGKALLMSALSAGLVLSVTSCVESYTVGFLYVTGTVTAQSGGNGVISGFRIDHNTGQLTPISGLPISSGGSNPGRALLLVGSKFLYVLNQGTSSNPAGALLCTTAYPCSGSNIVEFAVGGNGILTAQETFFTKGLNPFRIVGDSSGNYIYVLDHDSIGLDGVNPSSASNPNALCSAALGSGVNTCGDVTAFQVNQTTGRLSPLEDSQASANLPPGQALPYFPVPVNPVDFVFSSTYVLTVSGTPTTGDAVFPYTYASTSGQLSINQNTAQPLNIKQATAIVAGGSTVYVLDNEPISVDFNNTSTASASQILPFTVGTNGALLPETGGIVPDDPTLANPTYLLVESKGKFVYVANQGDNTQGVNAQSGIAGYFITPSPYYLTYIAGEPFGSGAGPQCIVEDPSDQFVYEADYNDSDVTGRVLDPNSGVLNPLRVANQYTLPGPAAWCLVDGRTS